MYFLALLLGFWFVPDSFYTDAYAPAARFVAAFFLLFQVMLLISITHDWNEKLYQEERWTVMWVIVILSYAASLAIIILMYFWFTVDGDDDCSLSNTTISLTLLGILGFSFLSMSSICPDASIMVSAVIAFYCAWMNFSALSSDPSTCNGTQTGDSLVWLIIGLIWSGISVTYSGWNAATSTALIDDGSDSERNDLRDAEDGDAKAIQVTKEKPLPEGMTKFFTVLGACAMYMAMLLTGWAASEDLSNPETNTSAASMWVQLASEWATMLLYVWVLIAPFCWPDRFENVGI
jgi:hypothetical protein